MARHKELRLLGVPDKIDRYRLILLGDKRANARDERYLEKIKKVWSLLRSGYSRSETCAMLIKIYDNQFSEGTGYRLVRMTESIFGSVNKVDIEGKRAILDEMFTKVYRLAMEEGTAKGLDVATRAADRLAKLHGVYRPNAGIEADPNQFMAEKQFVFVIPGTEAKNEIIDISHEEDRN